MVTRDGTAPTGVYFKDPDLGQGARTLYYRAGSAASRMAPNDSRAWPLEQTGWIRISGINAALSANCSALTEHLLAQARARGYKVSFDVNYRPALWKVAVAGPRLLELAGAATVVLVGLDEAETLWGCSTATEVAQLLPGPGIWVVKDSATEAVEFVRDTKGERARGQARPRPFLCGVDARHPCRFPPVPRNQAPQLSTKLAPSRRSQTNANNPEHCSPARHLKRKRKPWHTPCSMTGSTTTSSESPS
jgi:hypothetical protein